MTDSYNLLYFLYGASIMFHLMMAWVFLHGRHTRFRVFMSVLMFVNVALYVKDLIFIGDEYYSTNREERLASSVDVLNIPMFAIVLVEACRPMWLTWWRATALYLPMVLTCVLYLLMPRLATYYTLHVFAIVYSLGYVVWGLRELPLFERSLKEEYSFDGDINFNWLRGVSILFFCLLMLWIYGSLNPGPTTDVVYLSGSLFVWIITCFLFFRQARVLGVVMSDNNLNLLAQPLLAVDAEQHCHQAPVSAVSPVATPIEYVAPDDIAQTDTAIAADAEPIDVAATDPVTQDAVFAERMHLLFEKEHVYLNPRLRLSELAAMLGTNRTYMSQYFNQSCGSTFYDFVNDYRIHYAKILLHSTDDTLETIAMKAGFNSLSTFRRAFVQREGKSAMEFRLDNRKL